MKRYVVPVIMACFVMTGCSSPESQFLDEVRTQVNVSNEEMALAVYELGLTYCEFVEGSGSEELFYLLGENHGIEYSELYAVANAADNHLC